MERVSLLKKRITGSQLKIIAIIAMLIDHIAVGILVPYSHMITNQETLRIILDTYYGMRCIGRIAFPIFCFLLVEGFIHTKNIKKYALNLGLFVLISEIPFDLNFSGNTLSFEYQNVFFTLFIALIVLMGLKLTGERYKDNNILKWILIATVTVLGCLVVEILNTDYSSLGIITVVTFYLTRNNKFQSIISLAALIVSAFAINGFAMGAFELPAIFAIPAISMYNGQRGKNMKYFFYLFYPIHLMIIYFIAQALTR